MVPTPARESAWGVPLPLMDWCFPCEALMCVVLLPYYFIREFCRLVCCRLSCEPAREYARLDPDATAGADIEAGTASAAAANDAPAVSATADTPPEAQQQQTVEEELSAFDRAVLRYATPTELRLLLTHNERLGGVPIRLLSVRWLLFEYKATSRPRLEHRQALERQFGDAAFIAGEKLERVLAELEEVDMYGNGTYMVQVYKTKVGGEYKAVKCRHDPVPINFPSAAALSHMWLEPSHPDPEAKNLRTQWLPALEW